VNLLAKYTEQILLFYDLQSQEKYTEKYTQPLIETERRQCSMSQNLPQSETTKIVTIICQAILSQTRNNNRLPRENHYL
jgi:hypothetical protein